MATAVVTIIKSGRNDSVGNPLVFGQTYTLEFEFAKSLWMQGFATDTDGVFIFGEQYPGIKYSSDGRKAYALANPDWTELQIDPRLRNKAAPSMYPAAYQSFPAFGTAVTATYGVVTWTEGEPYGYRLVASNSAENGTVTATMQFAVGARAVWNGPSSNPTFPTFGGVRSPVFPTVFDTNKRVDVVSDFMPFTAVPRTDGYPGFINIVQSRSITASQKYAYYQIRNPSAGFGVSPVLPDQPMFMWELAGDYVSNSTQFNLFQASAAASAGIFFLGYTEIQWFLKDRKSVLFLGGGDSNMVGEFTLTGYNNFARKISQRFNVEQFQTDYCNVGRGAAQSENSYPVLVAKIAQYKPSVAFLQAFSGNNTMDATQYAASIERVYDFLNVCKANNAIPVIMSCMPKNTRTGGEAPLMLSMRTQIADICADEGIVHIDAMALLGSAADITVFAAQYNGDGTGLHSNEAGHQLLADTYYPSVRSYF